MTTYRLRDRKLQQKLDELSHGAFSEMLKTMGRFLVKKQATNVQLGESRFTVTLFREDIEIAPEYDPNDWNSFPEVMPPEDVLMRVETVGGDKFRGYFHTFPDGVGRWCCVCFTPRHMPLHETEKVRRYRPCE